jgi:hypothetical protein
MDHSRCRYRVAQSMGIAFALFCGPAAADEATGKVVWIDQKNSSLLLECPDKGCPQIPNSKPGETYTFVIPASLKRKIESLKEGGQVTLVYEDGKDKGYVITAVNDK